MSLFEATLNKIKRNISLKLEGKDLAIPFGFPRLDSIFPVIIKASYTIISANQKVGKSQICDYIYVINVINFLLNNNTNIKAKIFYFTLEMSKEAKMKQIMLYRLYMKHDLRLNTRQLDSYFQNEILDENIIKMIEEDKEWFDKLEEVVTFISDIKHPTGIFKVMEAHFSESGHWVYKNIESYDNNFNKVNVKSIKDTYIENDPDLYTFCIIDNYANLKTEGKQELFDAIGKFSTEYAIQLRIDYYCNVVAIQQQVLSNESVENLKAERMKPSSQGLSDNKQTSKDVDLLLTLFSPFRNKLREYEGYNITKLQDHYRELTIELDRNGFSCSTSLYFDGAVNVFRQLPEPTDSKSMELVYERIKKNKKELGLSK